MYTYIYFKNNFILKNNRACNRMIAGSILRVNKVTSEVPLKRGIACLNQDSNQSITGLQC